ncbi:Dolichyl-phosphate-mannose-protein mannosyltransferase-domain-containing protein [Chytriomyces sp. MP71]|nr:Dolichyl-phosphate-mannose-protein mannosyltransferase-domain-containing protein [Chytriomyces sp. MP71]
MGDRSSDTRSGWPGQSLDQRWRVQVPVALTLSALVTRLHCLGRPDFVVCTFATRYILRKFHFDVHPPLGKMALALAARVSGLDASFAFEVGAAYPGEVDYVVLRGFCATVGAFVVPLAYFTARELRLSNATSLLLAWMVLFDNALLTISRFILLDSMLLFSVALSAYCLVVFRGHQRRSPFSSAWHYWLFASGASLGLASSIKWVGLFAVALVGLHTLADLWYMLGDRTMTKITYARHWATRILGLILLPFAIYTCAFWFHFRVLNHHAFAGSNSYMDTYFQATLIGSPLYENPTVVSFNSTVNLRNAGVAPGCLYAPPGAGGRVVGVAGTGDDGRFRISPLGPLEAEPVLLRSGDAVRLVHARTGGSLDAVETAAPMTHAEWEVSLEGADYNGTLVQEGVWILEIVDDLLDSRAPVDVKVLTTRFRLRHRALDCLLRQSRETLPDTRGAHLEITCVPKSIPLDDSSLWTVEQHWNDQLLPGNPSRFRGRFWRNFAQIHASMWRSNTRMVPNPDSRPKHFESHAWQWPFASVGMRMMQWREEGVKIFLLGNPVLWAASAVALIVTVRRNRGLEDWGGEASSQTETWKHFLFQCEIGLGGWFLQYVPYLIMGRVTYVHHYLPALYFAFINLAVLVDHLGRKMPARLFEWVGVVFAFAVMCVFWYFKDFSYGFDGPAEAYRGRRWNQGWYVFDEK